MFSIIIPTWNNLAYVQHCVDSIRRHSAHPHQIILHINDGSDGTLAWAQAQNLAHTHTPHNAGICLAVNMAAALATQDYIVYMNDDMYVLPHWDTHLLAVIATLPSNNFMLSSTMIEPTDHHNPCVIVHNYGTSLHTFREAELLAHYASHPKPNWSGSAWPPTIVHRQYWQLVGGYSIELSPGMSSDDDFAMKMWTIGCRIFQGIGASRVYHFQAKSTQRIVKNDGRKQFLMKWGINQSTFNTHYLHRGAPYTAPLVAPSPGTLRAARFRAWLKRKLI
ncbi:MAG: glycosyltransferase family 2 protein [Chitinophagaceae bacterium]|nr:glycosyltransferase family 2 protein [Chitinophagaceae bacterium]